MLLVLAGALARPAIGEPYDPLPHTLSRIDRYLQQHESQGVAHDWRRFENPAEEARLGVVAQLLGYCELARVRPSPRYLEDVIARADYLLAHFEDITSETAFDGMLGYAFLAAYDLTKDQRYFEAATSITDRCRWLDGWTNTLNWGLMCAMDLAEYARLTADARAEAKARAIIDSLWEYRHRDGSFPHICYYSTDTHYTAWMSAEMILVARVLPDAHIEKLLAGTHAFLRRRIDAHGVTSYTDSMPPSGNYIRHYYSLGSGCVQDYDTRAWVNELGYMALALDRAADDKYYDVMTFLGTLEQDGCYPDKWDFMPDPANPLYFWASAEESVIRTSMVFWMLAAIEAGRSTAPTAVDGDATSGTPASPPALAGARLAAFPNPFAGSTVLRYELASGPARLTVCNARGEVVRQLEARALPAGRHAAVWDGRAENGAAVPAGVYFARLETPGLNLAAKLVRLE